MGVGYFFDIWNFNLVHLNYSFVVPSERGEDGSLPPSAFGE